MPAQKILAHLQSLKNPKNIEGMKRFGIHGGKLLGISIPTLRALAKNIGKNHDIAADLWASGIHEARLLAAFVDDPALVTKQQMESWVHEFDSWDICDQACGNLFDRTPFAYDKAEEWVRSDQEYVRRAGFAMMAALAVHDKQAVDVMFTQFFPLIEHYAFDDRNFVRKAVNWALRQIGKRNEKLRLLAIGCAERVLAQDTKAARWIARDALRELQSDTTVAMIAKRKKR